MPTVSNFYGIKISLFYNDHGIPHFRAKAGEYEANYGVETLERIVGELPPDKAKLVEAWAILRHKELKENASRLARRLPLHKIRGLK